MEHIRQVELEPGNVVPVGHAEFASASRVLGAYMDGEPLEIEFLPVSSTTTGGGVVCVNATSTEGSWELKVPVYIAGSQISSNQKGYTVTCTNNNLHPYEVWLTTYGTGTDLHYVLRIVCSEHSRLLCNVQALFRDFDVRILGSDNDGNWSSTSNLEVDEASDMLLSEWVHYGTDLPAPGIPGRLFFLEVQDE